MSSVLLWPLLPFVLEVGLIVYWVAVTAVLYSAGEPTAHWRQAKEASQPLGLQQLMYTNSSMTVPPPPAQPDTTNMTAQVRAVG
jgi:choline transporter-like protein 2/4/5